MPTIESGKGDWRFAFSASKANAIYKGDTLQTASLRMLAIIKA